MLINWQPNTLQSAFKSKILNALVRNLVPDPSSTGSEKY